MSLQPINSIYQTDSMGTVTTMDMFAYADITSQSLESWTKNKSHKPNTIQYVLGGRDHFIDALVINKRFLQEADEFKADVVKNPSKYTNLTDKYKKLLQ